MGSGHDIGIAKVPGELSKMVEDTLKEGVYVTMKAWHTCFVGSIPCVEVGIVH